MAVITLYSKPGCHLCDDAREALTRLQKVQPFDLEEVNILDEPGLQADYGEQIPVILLNGTFVFEYAVDETRLRQLLEDVQ
jgi:glutaredoxin